MAVLDLEHCDPDDSIISLMEAVKKHYSMNKTPAQLKLSDTLGLSFSSYIANYLKSQPDDQYVNPYRLEFYVYSKIYHHLERGRMFCNDSVSYRDIDADLVADEMVDQVNEIANKFGYKKIPIYCDERLDNLLEELDSTWDIVTENINDGHNHGINLTTEEDGTLSWQLNYTTSSKLDDSFFKHTNKIDIAGVFTAIDEISHFFDGFEHAKGRYIKRTKPTSTAIIACILSEAFGFGIKKMAEMSDMNYNVLRSVKDDFIRYETLSNVNDLVANFVNKLDIFKAWNLLDDKLLADIDGQKAATLADTIQSRYSKKYLGKGKGLSVLSLIANFIAIDVKNIGLNEYEAHHLYDMVYNNKSDTEIQAITGDNHSVNQLNFIALDMIDVEFMPSIKNIKAEAEQLYSVKEPCKYNGIIKPVGQIDVNRIKSYKRDILRVLLSLILQENTQSTIIRKLNSHHRYAGLRAALYEYNKIFKSIHILKMINNSPLRKAIRTARNRTEAYHQLQKLIRNMYYGVFKGRRIAEHAVSTQAVALVSNVIVAYNAYILNELYIKMVENNTDPELLERFLRISPMSWVHITFTGKYSFKTNIQPTDITTLVAHLEQQIKSWAITTEKAA